MCRDTQFEKHCISHLIKKFVTNTKINVELKTDNCSKNNNYTKDKLNNCFSTSLFQLLVFQRKFINPDEPVGDFVEALSYEE
jgi:hypothetical protein